jgi:hypothetical protein
LLPKLSRRVLRLERMADLGSTRRAFQDSAGFTTSPLYQSLSRVVATTDWLLDLAAQAPRGQVPTYLFFGAIHQLLLRGVEHPLRRYFPSIAGASALPAGEAGPALLVFCRQYRRQLAEVISTRLVQTNDVQRSLALRVGLSLIGCRVREPVHVVEVGASAGLNLRFDRYGYRVSGRQFGDQHSAVQVVAEQVGPKAVPDLDRIPPIATIRGVDLNPLDVTDPDACSWLEALVWPENDRQRRLLDAAIELVRTDPPAVVAGDAVDVLPRLSGELPTGQPRVTFQIATRMHVPAERRETFDDATASLGDTGPLWAVWVDHLPDPDPRPNPVRQGGALFLRTPAGEQTMLAVVDGHLNWIEML